MHIRTVTIAAVAAFGFAVSVAQAADFHFEVLDPVVEIPAVSDYQTTGADMAGMSVTAHFSAAPSETVEWMATGADSGQATGPQQDWTLSQQGDSFANPWTLIYQGGNKGLLTGFRIDGFAAGPGEVGVMFDRTFNGQFGTPDSYKGRDYTTQTVGLPFDTFVVYESQVAIAGDDPVGDEFRYLDVRFVDFGQGDEFSDDPLVVSGLDGDTVRTLSFIQDTNNPIVPEPASVALVAIGAALSLGGRRRK
jgi:hypothetical protein